MPPRAGRQAGQADVADADAGEAGDGMADGGQHPPHLPIAALMNCQFDLRRPFPFLSGAGAVRTDQPDPLGGRGHPVLQPDAPGQPRQGVGASVM